MSEPVIPASAFGAVPPPALTPVPSPAPAPAAEVDLGDVITDMSAFREQALEGLGVAGARFRPGPVGTEVFTVPHPLLLSDEQNEQIAKPLSFVEIAKVLLNTPDDPHVYDRFSAAGGRSGDVMMAWRRLSAGLDIPK
ncbi:hypothetical protein [Nocardia pseudovaccinii]|uniref:hypothetical protein n=1 Tax=Nocardia pseudovaccinii TaxID=189540 RepID=UPI0007A39DFA|nr:hypothetical protein [Nocardia pseudovaccinii]